MRKFVITQTGPAIGTGEVCFMAGEEGVEFYGSADTIRDAVDVLGLAGCFPDNQPFTIEYRPWEG